MKRIEELKQNIYKAIRAASESTMIGAVVSVNEDDRSCVVKVGDVEYEDVRLNSIVLEGFKGLSLIPSVESNVLVSKIGGSNELFVSKYSKVDKALFVGDNVNLMVDDVEGVVDLLVGENIGACFTEETVTFNKGALGSFMSDINKLVEHINTIEQDINALKDVFSNWTPAPQDGGGQLKAGVAEWAGEPITETTVDDIKDETIIN